MPVSEDHTFQIEEYKALRQEILAQVKEVRELNRWGLVGLAVVYSYIFSNLDKPYLFWVPVGLSAMIIALLYAEHRLIKKNADFVRDFTEREIAPAREFIIGTATEAQTATDAVRKVQIKKKMRGGWERFLSPAGTRLPALLWGPAPIWLFTFYITLVVAVFGFFYGSFAKTH